MYVDLELSETGDLLFMEKPEELQPQKITFNLSNTSAQKLSINFYDVEKVKHNSNNYLKVEFFIKKSSSNTIAMTCTNQKEKVQLIILKLKACLGELPERSSFGSKLSSYKHQNINDKTLKELETYLESILEKDIPAVTVKAVPFIDYDIYKQSVVISVFSNQNLLLDYKIER